MESCTKQFIYFKINKSKIGVFKKGGTLKKEERWTMYNQTVEVADEINYSGVTLECSGGWNRQKLKAVAKEIRLYSSR
jgi:hypothetical protein